MTVVNLPSFDSVEDALDWVAAQGGAVRVVLRRGPDGLIRGTALLRSSP